MNDPGRAASRDPTRLSCWERSEVHVPAARRTGRGLLLLRLVRHHDLRGEEQGRDGGGVLQRRPGHLGRVDDPGGEQVDVLAGLRVQAVAGRQAPDPLPHDAALEAGVDGDLPQRRVQRHLDDVRPGGLVAGQVQLLEGRLAGVYQRDAATRDDALLDGRLRVAHGVLDAVLALLQLDLGGRADLDDRDAAGQLGQPLLQLLPVVVGVALVDLGADLVDPALDLVGVTGTVDDRGLVLGHDHLAGATEQVEGDVLQLEADLFADDLATGQGGDVDQHGLAAVTEAGGLDGHRLEGTPDLVDDQGGQRLALDVLGDDQQRLAALHDLLQDRQQVLDRGDLLGGDEDVRVVEDGLHPLRVGPEVRRDVPLVEAHALGELQLQAEGVALLDGDDAFLADLVHRLGDDLADGGVARGDRRRRGDLLLGLDVLGNLGEFLGDRGHGGLDAPLQGDRVGTRGNVPQALADQCLGQHGGRRRAVTGYVVGLLGDLLDQLGAQLLVRVVQVDLFGDAHTVVGDGGGAPCRAQYDVAALRAQRHPYRVGEDVHATFQAPAGLFTESDQLGHLRRPLHCRAGVRHCSDRPAMTAAQDFRPGFHPIRLALTSCEC